MRVDTLVWNNTGEVQVNHQPLKASARSAPKHTEKKKRVERVGDWE